MVLQEEAMSFGIFSDSHFRVHAFDVGVQTDGSLLSGLRVVQRSSNPPPTQGMISPDKLPLFSQKKECHSDKQKSDNRRFFFLLSSNFANP